MSQPSSNKMTATLLAGGAAWALEFYGYAYPAGSGLDSNWLRGSVMLVGPGVRVEKRFLTLASSLPAWVQSLEKLVAGTDDEAVISNTEDDFALRIRHVGGDLVLEYELTLSDGFGRLTGFGPVTAGAIEGLRSEVEEASWVLPTREA